MPEWRSCQSIRLGQNSSAVLDSLFLQLWEMDGQCIAWLSFFTSNWTDEQNVGHFDEGRQTNLLFAAKCTCSFVSEPFFLTTTQTTVSSVEPISVLNDVLLDGVAMLWNLGF